MKASRSTSGRARSAGLPSAIGLALALASCAAPREGRVDNGPVPLPAYHVGDSFTYEENGSEETVFVTEVASDRIGWTDNLGAHWSTSPDPTLPPRSEVLKRGQLPLVRVFEPSGISLFPLQPGKRIEFTVDTTLPGERQATSEQQSCEARRPRPLMVEAGDFDAWEIVCWRAGQEETLYYAPTVGAVVLDKRDSRLSARRKTLVAYHKAGTTSASAKTSDGVPISDASEATTPPAASPSATPSATQAKAQSEAVATTGSAALTAAPPAKSNRKAAPVAALAPARVATTGLSGFVVQLAAYHSYGEAGRGWEHMKMRMPDLFHGLSPRVERVAGEKGESYVRLFVGPYANEAAARQLCDRLRAKGQACWPRLLP